MSSSALRLYGTDEALEPPRMLRAGPLQLALRGARLQAIGCGGHEIWHGLGFVLRDPDWGTPPAQVERIDVQADDQAFEARLDGFFDAAVRVDFQLRLSGSAEGSIRFEAEARPAADLAVNRLGLCLLHPLEACGARVEIGHVDGRTSRSTFPTLIPPWPPFMLVRSLRHEWRPGRWASATLEGDAFETEDQRNNADASFKTYSRSNMAPRPYRLAAGQIVRQVAELQVERPLRSRFQPQRPLRLAIGGTAGPWLPVGVEIHADDAREPALLPLLRELRPAHLHLSWRPDREVHWPGIAAMLQAAGARLRIDVLTGESHDAAAALASLQTALAAARLVPEALAVFPSHAANVASARRLFGSSALGGGSPHFFVQLSRLDVPGALGAVDFASFTTSSVVHGAEDDEVMLGLASLPGMVATWRARHPARPLRIGPSAIAARASPLGAQPASDGKRRLALAAIDPRTSAQFGAAWALGHVVGAAQEGVQALTLLALRGPNGLVTIDGGGVERHPAFHLLARLGLPARRLAVEVSEPRRVAALALERDGQRLLLAANLSAESIELELAGLPAASRLQRLAPYALALVEADAG